jgi:pimeloyl-ACP methyl ester carboxylesterase
VGDEPFTYYVQLPPEYDPYRTYPCIVTLGPSGARAAEQIDWWAGPYDEQYQLRLGHASKHGYIVIAPKWVGPVYSAHSHASVLNSLRDALRRFSIDTDRVFLSGHSQGGDAVWDIGLAHPDLWAGVIPIVATADKYVTHYWPNGKYVPLYFVAGQMDSNRTHANARSLDRYLTRSGFDCILVEYQGRGHERFNDELPHLFDWMELAGNRRNFSPREIECVTMRPWDNFFYWLEVDDLPSNRMVMPDEWQARSSTARVYGSLRDGNTIYVRTPANQVRVWLTPEMVDFEQPVSVSVGNRRIREEVQPSVEVMLEDARTRGDRLNPFWAKLESF